MKQLVIMLKRVLENCMKNRYYLNHRKSAKKNRIKALKRQKTKKSEYEKASQMRDKISHHSTPRPARAQNPIHKRGVDRQKLSKIGPHPQWTALLPYRGCEIPAVTKANTFESNKCRLCLESSTMLHSFFTYILVNDRKMVI